MPTIHFSVTYELRRLNPGIDRKHPIFLWLEDLNFTF
jgi:hypothetical protein